MNFLLIQEKGRHLANQEFREALNLSRALKKLGHDSVVWGLNYDNFNIPFEELEEKCDVIILLENYEINGWIPDLSQSKKFKIFWSIDSHCVPQQHVDTCNKHKIQLVLCAIEHHQTYFKKQQTIWFPNAYPDDLIFPMSEIEKKYDIGFCGNYLNRKNWIDIIKSKHRLKEDVFVIGNDMVRAINSYKIHFNKNLADDINFRTFETLGCKTTLFTNHTPGLEKLFDLNKHLVVYNSEKDLLDKISYYLKNTEKLENISIEGYNHVLDNHTYFVRAQQLTELLKEILY